MSLEDIMSTYSRTDLIFEFGQGSWLFTKDGKKILDFNSGIAVNALGHCHPHLVDCLQSQIKKLWHCSNLYRIESQELLASRLVASSFADSVFFCNSGAESVEAAIKVARRYSQTQNKNKKKYKIIVTTNAFHGRTLATISAGGQEKHLEGFYPVVDGFTRVEFGNISQLKENIDEETIAILVEPIQGEGGINKAADTYLREIREICNHRDLVLIFDEVQCGMGRSGRLFAHEMYNVFPDIMCLAKALGGGFPVGACLATKKVSQHMTPGTHGSTFGGNPLAMTAANALLDIILSEGFLDNVNKSSRRLIDGLQRIIAKHQNVFLKLKGQGLMLGIKCIVPNSLIVDRLVEGGLLSVVAGDNVVRLLPPLNISYEEIDIAINIIDEVANRIEIDNVKK